MAKGTLVSGLMLASLLLGLGPACQNHDFEEVIRWPPMKPAGPSTVGLFYPNGLDVLFVVDNSESMAYKQQAFARALPRLRAQLDRLCGQDGYKIAVVTTGLESPGCGFCEDPPSVEASCLNPTGESGRFQDRIGHNRGTVFDPDFEFSDSDPTCRFSTSDNFERCLYDATQEQGAFLVGDQGCEYERGLQAIREALSDPLLCCWNTNFLRPAATLAVVVLSDEDDCGAVGEVSEVSAVAGPKFCYYAANGAGPDGASVDPISGLPYALFPVWQIRDELLSLKAGRADRVLFAAITGLADPLRPLETEITFASSEPLADVEPACQIPGCLAACDPLDEACERSCSAFPGTRYVALAQASGFGDAGFVDTICQEDFSDTMDRLGLFLACPRWFILSNPVPTHVARVLINGEIVPAATCTGSTSLAPEVCDPGNNPSCSSGTCERTWEWVDIPSDPQFPFWEAPFGGIRFADHYNPCLLAGDDGLGLEMEYGFEME